jgi:hypothetical protein
MNSSTTSQDTANQNETKKKPIMTLTLNLEGISPLAVKTGSEMNLQTTIGFRALDVVLDNIRLLDKKNQDYGPGNIAVFGEQGVLVRASDKFERLKNLFSKKRKPRNEPITDSWRDISNYGVIAILVRKGFWS